MNAYIRVHDNKDGTFVFGVVVEGNSNFLKAVEEKNKSLLSWYDVNDKRIDYAVVEAKEAYILLKNTKEIAKNFIDEWCS